MPVPKRRHSKSRTRKRRANWKAKAPHLVACPKCGQPKLPHRICPSCGYYGEKKVIEPEE